MRGSDPYSVEIMTYMRHWGKTHWDAKIHCDPQIDAGGDKRITF